MTQTIEMARKLESLKESKQDEGLFRIVDYDYDNTEQVVFLDLRDGFSIYGYNGFGESLEVDRKKLPQEVKNLKSHKMAEGSAQLSDF